MQNTRKMKDSGVPWIGDIPEGWEVGRLRFLVAITTGNKDTINSLPDGQYPFYVRSPKIERIATYSFDGEAILMAGDGVGAGRVFHYANGKFDYHQRVYNLHNFNGIHGKFLFYYLKENFYKEIEQSNAKSTVDSIRLPMLLNFPVSICDYNLQQRIADFLDAKCARIDDTIAKEKELIAKLKEYRQSVITEAVTKGLHKDAPMKDSGIDWIGEIPEHWEVRKLKYVFAIKKDIAHTLGYDILSVTQNGIKVKDISKNEGQVSMDYSKYQLVNVGEFIMNHMDLLTGWVDCSKYKGVTSPDYRVFRLLDASMHNRQFFTYFFQTCYKQKIFYGLGQGVSNFGRWRLPTEQFINFQLPLPPLEEQEEIAAYLDKKTSLIDHAISQKEALMEKLNQYKKSLIYEVVTGKNYV